HQMAGAYLEVGASEAFHQLSVDHVQQVRDPCRLFIGGEPPAVKVGHHALVGEERDEVEATPHGGVYQGDGTVGRVHGADEPQILRKLEWLIRPVQGADALLSILEEEEELSENFGQIRPVDLIDDHDVAAEGVLSGS